MSTIYSVKSVLNSDESNVSIKDLDSIVHTPAIIIRKLV
jgi:hypothetical protein